MQEIAELADHYGFKILEDASHAVELMLVSLLARVSTVLLLSLAFIL